MCFPLSIICTDNEATDGEYCGTTAKKCQPGYKCDIVYRFCPQSANPCLPILGCVPISKKQPV